MKRVGITTYHFLYNYGTILQAYAMQKIFEDLGYYSEMIDYRLMDTISFQTTELYKRFRRLPYVLIHMNQHMIKFLNRNNLSLRGTRFSEFCDIYIRKSEKSYETVDDLKKTPPEYDVYVTGSDQVWNPYLGSSSEAFYLTFAPLEKTTMSYAPSVGVNEVSSEIAEQMKKWLKNVQHLSVREKRGCEIIAEITDRPVQQVLDPTLLQTSKQWNEIAVEPQIEVPYILCYFLGDAKYCRKYVEQMQRQTGYMVIVLPISYVDMVGNHYKMFDVGPAEFLGLIKNASFICTDSFHGTIFAINYQKPFVSFCKREDSEETSDNSRIYNVLELFHLESRLIKPGVVFSKNMLALDYEITQGILDIEREKSIAFIQKAIGN